MRPIRLEIENFLGIERVELDFSPGVYVLVGRNGAGKSSIFEAILFSLYGQGVRFSRNVYDYVRYGRRTMRVRFVFERSGVEYEVIREVVRDGRLNQHIAVLSKKGESKPIATGAKEVRERVTKVIGVGLEIFKGVFFIPQGRITSLVDSESDFRKVIMDILDIKRRKEKLREALKDLERELESKFSREVLERTRKAIEELGGDPSELDRQIEKLRLEREGLRNIKEDREKNLRELDSVLRDLESVENLERELRELEEKVELDSKIRSARELAPLLKEYDDLSGEIDALRGKLKDLRRRSEKIERSLKESEDLLITVRERRSDLEKRSRDLSSRIESLREILSKSAPLLKDLERSRTSLKMREGDLKKLEVELKRSEKILIDSRKRLDSLERELESLRNSLEELEVEEHDWMVWRISKDLRPGDRCPVCGSTVEELAIEEVNFDPNALEDLREREKKLSTDVEVERERIASLERKISELDLKREDILTEISTLKESIADLESRLESIGYRPDLEDELSHLESNLKFILKEMEEVAREEARISEKRASYLMENKMINDLISETLSKLEEREKRFSEVSEKLSLNLKKLSMSLEELRTFSGMEEGGHIVEYERKRAVLEDLKGRHASIDIRDIEEMRSKREEISAELEDLEGKIAEISESLGKLDDRKSRLVEELKRLEELEKEAEKASDELKVVRFLKKILEANRFDDFVFKKYVRIITDIANVHLARVTHGEFELFLRNGSIFVRRGGIELPVGALSGGEKTLVALMLAMGISDAFVGNVGAMFIDEGFGALDDRNRIRVAGILKDLETLNRVIIFITHFEDLKDLFERKLIMDGGVLKLE